MERTIRTACPLSCQDACSFLVKMSGEKVLNIRGDLKNPQTKGFLCNLALEEVEKLSSLDRVRTPLLKKDGRWQKISWEDAFSLLARKIAKCRQEGQLEDILHYPKYDEPSLIKQVDKLFFRELGEVSEVVEKNAINEAFLADFSRIPSRHWADTIRSKTIFLWGKDPLKSNIHLAPYILEAKKQGAKVISINPVKTKSSELDFADEFVFLRPATDGALALGMLNVILTNGWFDLEFIQKKVSGFKEIVEIIKDYPLERVARITGISEEKILNLARSLAISKPSLILLGSGMNNYTNSFGNVRLLNALQALTGNLCKEGAGIFYQDGQYDLVQELLFPRGKNQINSLEFAEKVLKKNYKVLFLNRANPVLDNLDTEKTLEALRSIDFKVCLDYFLTDSAEASDLFLPLKHSFEEESIYLHRGNYSLQYARNILENFYEEKSVLEICQELAKRLDLKDFSQGDARSYLQTFLEKIYSKKIALETIEENFLISPFLDEFVFSDGNFPTPDSRVNLYSKRAEKMNQPPLANYQPSERNRKNQETDYKYQVISLSRKRKGSEELSLENGLLYPNIYLNPLDASEEYFHEGNLLVVESEFGQLEARVVISENVLEKTVVLERGQWLKNGGAYNFLTNASFQEKINNRALNELKVNLRKIIY